MAGLTLPTMIILLLISGFFTMIIVATFILYSAHRELKVY
jgi:hypothetical protein